jgi:putative transposase
MFAAYTLIRESAPNIGTENLIPVTNAIERLNEEFRRRIKTQTVLPCAETVPMLLWALLASGQIQMRKVDGWETLSQPLEPMHLDLAA